MVAVPAATPVTITYEVRGKGNTGSLERFAALAAQTLDDPRGWGLGGSIRFVRVAAGGSFTLWLSAPQYVPTFASGCSSTYSCRVGRNVIINEARFNGAITQPRNSTMLELLGPPPDAGSSDRVVINLSSASA